MAAAQLKLQAFEPALNSVEAVLKCQPTNVKALFRKGKILGEKGDTEKALKVLQRAKELEPEDKLITVVSGYMRILNIIYLCRRFACEIK
jgi:FK506-binding protein 8